MEELKYKKMISAALELGLSGAEVISVDSIVTSAEFREACEANRCGVYGKCWMCPPDVGDIYELMECVRGYSHALLYQLISPLEDSYDIEGMTAARKAHSKIGRELYRALADELPQKSLHLSCGGCGVCKKCSKIDGEPCRFPNEATASLEAYGINVYETVKNTSLKYINGQNTVTYFGLILFLED
ncbi:MAG: DUF2284 domain-containing protein [Clostridia bacterium]|nr:DUF2284 domain-containing protein [Clostridia bacterium]